MRLCRVRHHGEAAAAFYADDVVVPLPAAAAAHRDAGEGSLELPLKDDLITLLPPDGPYHQAAQQLSAWVEQHRDQVPDDAKLRTDQCELLVPVPRPEKIFLLAGNYAEHIEEGGDRAAERAETFPYVFMKPATTLTAPGQPITLPAVSPNAIDWELELAVVMGRRAKCVSEAEALDYVAGYTVINDISNRKFRPNPDRKQRPRDAFFDWLHGKWFDSFCPCGPCITSADAIANPQSLAMQLALNGEVRQDASTAQQIFPVVAVIEFISQIVTLEPGDMISTGTPSGVGHTTGTYLKAGDELCGTIESIGALRTTVVDDSSAP